MPEYQCHPLSPTAEKSCVHRAAMCSPVQRCALGPGDQKLLCPSMLQASDSPCSHMYCVPDRTTHQSRDRCLVG